MISRFQRALARQVVFGAGRCAKAENELAGIHFGKQFGAHLSPDEPQQQAAGDQVGHNHQPTMSHCNFHDPREVRQERSKNPCLDRLAPVPDEPDREHGH